MSLSVRNNLVATQVANNLSGAYKNMSSSVKRLSTGLRINSGADDASGLAIRELMRADISAINQGVRNATDAISMLQTHDAALGVIDEKLIRLKELAEQAATGTYNSTQRQVINNEFQEMVNEIDRIANSTNFNGIKLLCNDDNGKMGIPYLKTSYSIATVSSAGTPDGPVSAKFEVTNQGAVTSAVNLSFTSESLNTITDYVGDPNIVYWQPQVNGTALEAEVLKLTDIKMRYNTDGSLEILNHNGPNEIFEGTQPAMKVGNSYAFFVPKYLSTLTLQPMNDLIDGNGNRISIVDQNGVLPTVTLGQETTFTFKLAKGTFSAADIGQFNIVDNNGNYPGAKVLSQTYQQGASANAVDLVLSIDLDGDGAEDAVQTFTQNFAAPVANPDGAFYFLDFGIGSKNKTKIHFGPGNDSAEDYYYIEDFDATKVGLGLDRLNVVTQDSAQKALVSLDRSIERKDQIRAYFGAMQNRLENTVTNLKIQSENLGTAESRISDADIAKEMTGFVRNQILTKSAVAMLAQANTMPQMAMSLLHAA